MRKLLLSLVALTVFSACEDKTDTGTPNYDNDGDGYSYPDDCDETDPDVNPGATESCDGIDNDCDGSIDEDDAEDAAIWYEDQDTDGWGSEVSVTACEQPSGYVQYSGDCDDTSGDVYPGAAETECDRDYNCDGISGQVDTDLDGYNACGDNNDCDDTNAEVNPGMTELCDWAEPAPGVDENCDGYFNSWPSGTSEDTQFAGGALTYYLDADGDGYGADDGGMIMCPGEDPEIDPEWTPTDDYLLTGGDCDDLNPEINPNATEICDELDNDCDEAIDDEDDDVDPESLLAWYYDADEDSYGDPDTVTWSCAQPEDYVDNSDDCHDDSADVNPDADEYCNGYDDDCDGDIDEADALDAASWSIDYDDDGYGNSAYTVTQCEQPTGYVADSTDCDDTNDGVNPAAEEICDGLDNDCDGDIDGESAVDVTEWFQDADGDGYGDPGSSVMACDAPDGYVGAGDDCDDSSSTVSPSGTEECNGYDDDCDTEIDENDAIDAPTWYLDADGDGYGLTDSYLVQCYQPTGYAELTGECDDSDANVNPSATEYCDSIDNDCDGLTDESGAVDAPTWYLDADSDDFGDASNTTTNCNQPTGYVADSSDCDDSDDTINPEAQEICNDGIDNNCDGLATGCGTCIGSADLRIHGEAASDGAGIEVATVGDLDGDGSDDLFFSAYWNDTLATDAGAVYLFYGPFSAAGDVSAANADVILTGEVGNDRVGYKLTGGADITDNGYADLLIASIGDDDAGTNAGAAFVIEGPITDSFALSESYAKILNQTAYTTVQTVVMPGDITNNGYEDIIIGSPYDDMNGNNTGTLFIVAGPLTGDLDLDDISTEVWGENIDDKVGGDAIASPGDLNGDGIDDLVIGNKGNDTAASEAGAVYLLSGPITSSMDLADADNVIYGEGTSHQAGKAVVATEDVNGDGNRDILLGATGADSLVNNGGACYLIYDPSSITSLADADVIVAGTDSADSLGSDVAMDVDLDGDGAYDLLVGITGYSNDTGALGGAGLVFYGPLGSGTIASSDADHRFYGSVVGDAVGDEVLMMGSYDGAGSAAIIVSAYGSDLSANDAGGVFMFFNLGL